MAIVAKQSMHYHCRYQVHDLMTRSTIIEGCMVVSERAVDGLDDTNRVNTRQERICECRESRIVW